MHGLTKPNKTFTQISIYIKIINSPNLLFFMGDRFLKTTWLAQSTNRAGDPIQQTRAVWQGKLPSRPVPTAMAEDGKRGEVRDQDQLAEALADLFNNVSAMVHGDLQVTLPPPELSEVSRCLLSVTLRFSASMTT